jgi:CelD/BcsL family acetyltransferase involved in cellulose biosynthesis
MDFEIINPLADNRWDELVARHSRASVFHQRGWLEALQRTYNYQPQVVTNAGAGAHLSGGLALCRVSSWITGARLVSVPFADHCEPLWSETDDPGIIGALTMWLRKECDRQRFRYVELRTNSWNDGADHTFKKERSYYLHNLDLIPSLGKIFERCHRDCIQRRIRHAERQRLLYETGNNQRLLEEFYDLLTMTRRRHRLVPQPRAWFRNLLECMGDRVQIRLVRKEGIAIAAILTLTYRSSVVYKYGCSDARYHTFGAMPFLFWRLIEESKEAGAEEIDFGRTDLDNRGLMVFKDRFGTKKSLQTYLCYRPAGRINGVGSWSFQLARQMVTVLPNVLLPLAGKIMYRHVG